MNGSAASAHGGDTPAVARSKTARVPACCDTHAGARGERDPRLNSEAQEETMDARRCIVAAVLCLCGSALAIMSLIAVPEHPTMNDWPLLWTTAIGLVLVFAGLLAMPTDPRIER
jgi:hypothetical protein